MSTTDRVRGLLVDAIAAYTGTPQEDALRASLDRLDGPLRVAFAGRVKAGKSTLLNALVGQRLAATDATECTRIVTSYVDGPATRAWVHRAGVEPVQVPFRRIGGQTHIDLGTIPADEVTSLVVETPSSRLATMTLIDTPGIGSVRTEISARTEAFLVEDAPGADAVLYLMRHLHAADVGFLGAMQDDTLGRSSPVNALGILSRADEIAGGREDSLEVAARVASDYAADRRVRALVQGVVPVSGLLAMASVELEERQFAGLRDLATAPTSLLLSADRLVDARPDLGPSRELRSELLDLLGLFGIRLAVSLVRLGNASDAGSLAVALRVASGLDEVRTLLRERFAVRSAVLQARGALQAIGSALDASSIPRSAALRRGVESVVAGAHELTEMAVLEDLRTGELELGDEEALADAERLLGVDGDDPRARLGLATDSDEETVHAGAREALRRWQQRSSSPIASPDMRRVATDVRRTCEGLLQTL
ncbi:dynamin family protein [Cellulomonas sp. URHD0024]|uniref:dynamin family protein n=1 Tax=Cellulomonas sp. URHD0024 TaxID=1302620 RepID=UPI000405F7E5|nr:dynamin family protein [Cellulomonas sp. URHD0024]